MARFFFDTNDGTGTDIDDEGVDFTDAASAKNAAKSILATLMAEKATHVENVVLEVVVRDEGGGQIYSARMALETSQPVE